MPCIEYVQKEFRPATMAIIHQANQIIKEYQAKGFNLTLRGLYYQFVSRALLANTQRSYKRLGNIVNDGRLAGWIDWDAIEDRTRELKKLPHWPHPKNVLQTAAEQFRRDRWGDQPNRVEVWIEKQALAGIFGPTCNALEVPFFCCRGNPSQSSVWGAGQRLYGYETEGKGQDTIVLHFGDHDPSGMDMTRDLQDRLELFETKTRVHRIALNMDQVDEFNPPPNPVKTTDSKSPAYVATYGESCWELDALAPETLAALVEKHVLAHRDEDAWSKSTARDQKDAETLTWVAKNWKKVSDLRGAK